MLYKRRWLMLLLYSLASMSNAAHWQQYAIIGNVTADYYRTSFVLVNATVLMFMIVYIPFFIPVAWIQLKKGLKFSLLIGCVLTAAGSLLKLLSLGRNSFYVAFISQAIIGSAQVIFLSLPARLANVWFQASEVSTACGLGIIGDQVGVAVGFITPPLLVKTDRDETETRIAFRNLQIVYCVPAVTVLILVIIFFESAPPTPPSIAEENRKLVNFANNFKSILRNKEFIALICCYSILIGVLYTVSTFLNKFCVVHFPEKQLLAGLLGLTCIVGGIIGTFTWGYFLDKTRLYKATTIFICFMSFISYTGFTLFFIYERQIGLYVSTTLIGFLMNGFVTVAYEYTIELTYPVHEWVSIGVLNIVGQLVALLIIFVCGIMIEKYEDWQINSSLCCLIFIGAVISILISDENLKRQTAENDKKASRQSIGRQTMY